MIFTDYYRYSYIILFGNWLPKGEFTWFIKTIPHQYVH